MAPAKSSTRRWLERSLILAGVACLGWVGVTRVERAWYGHEEKARVDQPQTLPGGSPLVAAEPAGPLTIQPPALPGIHEPLDGILSIPRLHYSEAVAEGDDAETLRKAIGHLPDTSVPWRDGNTALAGRRDTLFRSLRSIRAGDELTLRTSHGDFAYRVRDTLIVNPDDVWVLAPTAGERQLTLI